MVGGHEPAREEGRLVIGVMMMVIMAVGLEVAGMGGDIGHLF
jgi:hypothetical protein